MLNSYTDPPPQIMTYTSVWHVADTESGASAMPIVVEQQQPHSGRFRVKLHNVTDRTQATHWTHRLIVIPRTALVPPEEGQFYWADLVGLTVYNTQGQLLGRVDHLFDTGANDVVVIHDPAGRAHLVPYIPSVIQSVNLAKQTIIIDWEFLESRGF